MIAWSIPAATRDTLLVRVHLLPEELDFLQRHATVNCRGWTINESAECLLKAAIYDRMFQAKRYAELSARVDETLARARTEQEHTEVSDEPCRV